MNHRLNKKKIFILISIILVLILFIIFTILYSKNASFRGFFDKYIFRKNIVEGTLPEISYGNSDVFAFDNQIISLENNILTFFNKSASKAFSLDVDISEPIFKTCGNYLCIAEKNGYKLYLIQNRNIVWQKDIDGHISDVSLNKNGYVAVAISDKSYKTICKVFSDTGTELFTTFHSKTYVIDSAISNDNKYLALAEVDSSGINISSAIKIISIDTAISNSTNSIQYSHIAPSDNLIINIDFCNNSLVCIYDNHIDVISNNSCNELTHFENTNVIFADINNKLIQIEKKPAGLFSSEFELQITNVNNQTKKIYTLKKEPKSIEVLDDIIAVNFGTEALFINNNSWLIKDYSASQEINSIILSDNLAGIIFKDKIEFLSL